jgi:hypothetical protein
MRCVIRWPGSHLQMIRRLYESAPCLDRKLLEALCANPPRLLADFTIATTIELASILGIDKTRFPRSSAMVVIRCSDI